MMTTPQDDEFVVSWPTLGFLGADWIEQHCPIPDGFRMGDPFVMYDWQLWVTLNHYRVKPGSPVLDGEGYPMRAAAFHNRRSQVVAPQKTGKGPWSASLICFEAVGPAVFAGWAQGGEAYDCADHGCSCGWGFDYEPGDPMGMPWPSPLIQILATSEDQTDNVYRPLQGMIRQGPLCRLMRVGEGFIRCPNDGRIDPVTSKASSKLGNPLTFAIQDETGIYTKSNGMRDVSDTQRRGVTGMGGRLMETTNAWDPAQESVAQLTYETRAEDVFRYFRQPPASLGKYTNKADRRRIHAYAYHGSRHVNLDIIEAEVAELLERDPAQAERFFGNRLVQGAGSWLPDGLWERAYAGAAVAS